MKEFLNSHTLFNTVAMFIKESSSLLLVVEGDDDHFILRQHTSSDLNVLAGMGGRQNVLRAATIARERGLKGVKFLVDRDYDDLNTNTMLSGENVYVSDQHDVIMDLLVNSGNLHQVVDIHTRKSGRQPGSRSKTVVPASGQIIEEAFDLASMLAAARIVNHNNSYGLDFTRFSFGALKVAQFSVEDVVGVVISRCQREDMLSTFLIDSTKVHEETVNSEQKVVGDHDLFHALARVLSRYDIKVQDKALVNTFMAGLTCAAVVASSWFDLIEEWCSRNNRVGFSCRLAKV